MAVRRTKAQKQATSIKRQEMLEYSLTSVIGEDVKTEKKRSNSSIAGDSKLKKLTEPSLTVNTPDQLMGDIRKTLVIGILSFGLLSCSYILLQLRSATMLASLQSQISDFIVNNISRENT